MGMVEKAFILLICMNLFLNIYMPEIWQSPSQTAITGQFINTSSGVVSMENTAFAGELPNTLSQDTAVVGSGTLSLSDAFETIWSTIKFVIGLFFAPIILAYLVPGIPLEAALLIGSPVVLIVIFGTISFIRGYSW